MHIDDLLNAYQTLHDDAALRRRGRFRARQQSIMQHMNQRVMVRDLVVRTVKPGLFGESDLDEKHSRPDEKGRLRAHISSLMRLLNEDHRIRLCESDADGGYRLKDGKRNHITRLSTPEFSLYTKKPLLLSEFESLVSDISDKAGCLEPNTHLLLSTIPVITDDKTLLNMSVYIQGGSPVVIRTFAKSSTTRVDVSYEEAISAFTQVGKKDKSKQTEQISERSGLTVNTGSVFEVITEGGARYTQSIDVCRDHVEGHAKSQLMRKLESDAYDTEVIPAQIEQCVTANSVMLVMDQCIARHVLLVDPNMSMIDFYGTRPGQKAIHQEGMTRVLGGMPSRMKVGERQAGYYVEHPPFGGSYLIDVLAERPLSTFKQSILPSVISHNKRVLQRAELTAPIHHQETDAIEKMVDLHRDHSALKGAIVQHLRSLEATMLYQCKPNLFESAFKTEGYHQKTSASCMIQSRFEHLYENIEKSDERFLFLIKPFQKDLAFRLAQVPKVSGKHAVIEALKGTLKTGMETGLKAVSDISFRVDEESSRPRFK